jgi:hypothetical protein
MADTTYISTFFFLSDDESIGGEVWARFTISAGDIGWDRHEQQYLDEPTADTINKMLKCTLEGEAFDYEDLNQKDQDEFISLLFENCEALELEYED